MKKPLLPVLGAVIALLSCSASTKARAADDYFVDQGVCVELSGVRTVTRDGVPLEGARLGLVGVMDFGVGGLYVQHATGEDRTLTDVMGVFGLRVPFAKRLEAGPYLRGGFEFVDGGPRDGSNFTSAAGFDVGVWVTRRIQLLAFIERVDTFEDSRRDFGLSLRGVIRR